MQKENKNQIAAVDNKFAALSPSKQREVLLNRAFKTAEAVEFKYTEAGKRAANNALVGVQNYLAQKGKSLNDIDVAQLALSIHAIACTELDMAAMPSECYVDMRGDVVSIKPQGAGNEKLVSRFGRGIKNLRRPWIVRKGDEFTLPQYDGLDVQAPKWTPKSMSGKVLMVVYPAEMKDGSVEWLMADRSSVIANVVAQCRQNALYAFLKKDADGHYISKYNGKPTDNERFAAVDEKARDAYYERLNGLAESADGDLDKFLESPEVKKYINPTYTSYGSKEAMIIRKMENNALKKFPRDFTSEVIAEAVDALREDRDESVEDQKPQPKRDVIDQVEEETKALPKGDAVPDFDVNEETGEVNIPEPQKVEEAEVDEKPAEAPQEAADKQADDYDDLM